MKYKSLEKLGKGSNKAFQSGKVIRFINKTLTAIFLGLVFLIVMEYSPKFKNFMQNEVLEKYFGKILPNTNDNVVKVFNEEISYISKEKYLDGYKLNVEKNYLVPNISSGVVVFIGDKEDFGNVIVIEGEDGSTIAYGNIKNSDIKLYDYVNSGQYLGETVGDYLYLIMQKDGEYLDIEKYLS